jgi:formylglycine-generating enzyme required for sulfatase activity
VDITYTIDEGQDVSSSDFSKVVFTAVIGGVAHTIDGTTVGASSSTGTHKVTWTLPSGLKSADCTMTAAVYPADVPSGNDYMIIDLDTGAISYEGLYATQEESNSRYNTALYKTDKMVLRKVPAGTYRTGDSTHYPSTLTGTDSYKINTQKNWTTDRDYYMGVFPVTHVQYAKVFDMDPSSKTAAASGNIADHRPVEGVSWFRLRCDAVADAYYVAATSSIPAAVGANKGTFFQRLNYRTGKYFDLPTEVMWEIAARAGTDTYFYWGNTTNDIGTASNNILDYVICKLNSGSLTFAVGSRLPNNWGLYDMVGNVTQLCLDDTVSNSMSLRKDAFTPATVSNPGSQTDASEKRSRSCLS